MENFPDRLINDVHIIWPNKRGEFLRLAIDEESSLMHMAEGDTLQLTCNDLMSDGMIPPRVSILIGEEFRALSRWEHFKAIFRTKKRNNYTREVVHGS